MAMIRSDSLRMKIFKIQCFCIQRSCTCRTPSIHVLKKECTQHWILNIKPWSTYILGMRSMLINFMRMQFIINYAMQNPFTHCMIFKHEKWRHFPIWIVRWVNHEENSLLSDKTYSSNEYSWITPLKLMFQLLFLNIIKKEKRMSSISWSYTKTVIYSTN